MAPDPSLSESLWKLFQVGLIQSDMRRAIELIALIRSKGPELPPKIDALLTECASTEYDATALWNLALASVEAFYFGVEERTTLIALLTSNGRIGLERAFALLSFDGVNTDELSQSVRHVADVLWLVKQDFEFSGVDPQEGGLLAEALKRVADESGTMAV